MASQTVTDPTELRNAIQQADTLDIITMDPSGSPYSSVGSLAKKQSPQPPIPIVSGAAGYTIDGSGSTIYDTRIYQNNIDGPAPGTVTNLTLEYTTAAANTNAILRATEGTYDLINVDITGMHSGWTGNSGVYMSLNSQTPNNVTTPPSTAKLNLNNVSVDVKGQAGFNPADPNSGTAFLQSWNNTAGVDMNMTTFDEAGFRNSFHFATFSATSTPPATLLGDYTFTDVKFTRSANATVRKRGNVLESVNATFDGNNTFENGSFLDISGDISKITFITGSRTEFLNIPTNGYGIRVSATSPSGQTLLGMPNVQPGAMIDFAGTGLALKYENAANGAFTSLPIGTYSVNGQTFSGLTAGGQGDDTISGGSISEWISGDLGNDSINGQGGSDYITGGDGNDIINGGNGTGSDTLDGGAGTDTITFAGGAAVNINIATGISTGQGMDYFSNFENVIGSGAADTITGSNGADNIDGGSGNDTVFGGLGDDTIDGSGGADSLFGGAGNDSIDGGSANDTINGGAGIDILTGGLGLDVFVYNSTTEGQDVINNFALSGVSKDTLTFNSSAFVGVPIGPLTAANFTTNPTAPTSAATFIYNGGVLSFDADGSGSGVAVGIATLTGSPALTIANITIF